MTKEELIKNLEKGRNKYKEEKANGTYIPKKLTPMKAIRKKCLNCSNFSSHEVRQCPITDCSLYEFRFGKRPETTLRNATQ